MIRLGVVGFGLRSELLVNVFRDVEPDVKVVGIVDPDEAGVRTRLMAADQDAVFYADLATMVKTARLDGLMIGTRCNLHAEYAIEAAHYGIPLFLEKPVATSMEQATRLEQAFITSPCPVVVSFPLRLTPLCRMTKRYLQEGRIGEPQHICATNFVPYGTVYWEDGYHDYQVTQGLFLQKATHDFDYMMFLMNSPVVRVAAMTTRGRIFGGDKPRGLRCSECGEAPTCPESPRNRKRGDYATYDTKDDHHCVFSVDCGNVKDGINEESSSAVVEFASGVHGVYTQVFLTRRDAKQRGAIISGYDGTLSFDWWRDELKYVRHHEPFSDTITGGHGLSHNGGDHELALDYFDAIKGRGQIRSTIWMGLQSVYACLAAKESARTGTFVNVKQVAPPPSK